MIRTIDEKQFIRDLKLVNPGNRCFFSGMVFLVMSLQHLWIWCCILQERFIVLKM